MSNRNCFFLLVFIGVVLLSQSCAAQTVDKLPTPVPPQDTQSAVPEIEPTGLAVSLNEMRSSTELNKDLLQEVTFFAGGAGCGFQNIGVDAGSCQSSQQWPISLQLKGVFRVSDQGMINPLPWWGDKFSSCYETLQYGDMVYLAAKGLPEGEPIKFTIQGPNGQKSYTSMVNRDIEYPGGNICKPYATAPAARLSWVVDSEMGAGKYTVTAEGKSEKATMEFTVEENQAPNFGVSVGDTSLPLVLGPERMINLVYSKFKPNQIVTTLLYNPAREENGSKPIRYINTKMDQNGSAVQTIKWDSTLPPGKYWLLVPDIIPQIQPNPKYADLPVEPALWGIYFFADTPPLYDPKDLYLSTEDIVLRASCGAEFKLQANKTINLRYGIWGANGMELLQSTKDKIITRLFVNGKEVAGYRPDKVVPASEMPCGNLLKNEYFLYNETQIGPFDAFSDPGELDIRVEYSFADTVTDGYDLSPKDGTDDQYSPSTPFYLDFKIKLLR